MSHAPNDNYQGNRYRVGELEPPRFSRKKGSFYGLWDQERRQWVDTNRDKATLDAICVALNATDLNPPAVGGDPE